MIYETTTRPREVLESRIELWNRTTGEITFPKTKGKYNRWTRRHIPGAPKTMKLTGNTSEMLRHYVGNRKKGDIFINVRTGKRLTLRHFEKMIDKWARLLNIQKLQSIKPSGREYHLITLMGLREAGERHHDLNGGDPDVSAKAAGHSKETKARYYKKVSCEEAIESFGRHHPAFVEGW
ncbi:MAG TPA: hypothetical protein VMW53_04305 [archaeon]|nr:hypothetical protein [archaeon]